MGKSRVEHGGQRPPRTRSDPLKHTPIRSQALQSARRRSGPLKHAPIRSKTLRRIFRVFFPVGECFFRLFTVLREKALLKTVGRVFFGLEDCLSGKNILRANWGEFQGPIGWKTSSHADSARYDPAKLALQGRAQNRNALSGCLPRLRSIGRLESHRLREFESHGRAGSLTR